MTEDELAGLVNELRSRKKESGWVEFKKNNDSPETMGENISALANSATLHDKDEAYLIFGVDGETYEITGTTFDPDTTKVKKQDLEAWLLSTLNLKLISGFMCTR